MIYLSNEVLFKTFSFLEPENLNKLAFVSKKIRESSLDPVLWKNIAKKMFLEISDLENSKKEVLFFIKKSNVIARFYFKEILKDKNIFKQHNLVIEYFKQHRGTLEHSENMSLETFHQAIQLALEAGYNIGTGAISARLKGKGILPETVDLILKAGEAIPNKTTLLIACQNGASLEIIKLLLKFGCKPSDEALKAAIKPFNDRNPCLKTIQLLLEFGAKASDETLFMVVEREDILNLILNPPAFNQFK